MWPYICMLHRYIHNFSTSFTQNYVRPLGFSSSRQCCIEIFTAKTGLPVLCRMQNNFPVAFWAIKVVSSVKFANLRQIHSFRARCFLDTAQYRGSAKLEHLLRHLPPFTHISPSADSSPGKSSGSNPGKG